MLQTDNQAEIHSRNNLADSLLSQCFFFTIIFSLNWFLASKNQGISYFKMFSDFF